MNHDDLLKLRIRHDIYHFINDNPGLHIRDISRRMNIPRSTLGYHLNFLDKHDLIIKETEGNYTRFYIKNNINNKDKIILGFLRKKTPRRILMLLSLSGLTSQVELSERLEISPKAVNFYLKKLLDAGVIKRAEVKNGEFIEDDGYVFLRRPVGNEILYCFNDPVKDPYAVLDLLIVHKKSIDDDLIDIYIDYYDGLVEVGIPKKILSYKNSIDKVIKIAYDIFPHPYHV